jgi:hypothetical protein
MAMKDDSPPDMEGRIQFTHFDAVCSIHPDLAQNTLNPSLD